VREIEMLRGKKEVFARRFWTLIEGQIAILQEHMTDMVEVDSLRQKAGRLAVDAQEALAAEPAPARPDPRASDPLGGEFRGTDPRMMPSRRLEPEAGATRAPEAWAPTPMEPVPAPERIALRRPEPMAARPPEPAPVATPPLAPEAAAPPPEEPAARRNVPKGLRSLLRGRQAQLPLEQPAPPAEAEPAGESSFATLERREGFFELRAGEGKRDEASKRFRSSGLDRP
jgi:hypothetical protein